MPEHIGNAGNTAMALATRIRHSLIARNKPDIESKGSNEGLELPYHEVTQGAGQHRPQESVQRRFTDRDTDPVSSVATRTYSEMILPAPAATTPVTTRTQTGRNEIQAREMLPEESSAEEEPESTPQINAKDVADKVYLLMRRDLMLEKELPDRGNKLW